QPGFLSNRYRQIERFGEGTHLCSCRDMRHGHLRVDPFFSQIEKRKARWEHLPKDHTLAKPRACAEAYPACKRFEYGFHSTLVLRIHMRQPVADDDPIDLSAV